MKKYPNWICLKCGNKYGIPKGSVCTFHNGKCEVCEKETDVTEPRDYSYPVFPGHEELKKVSWFEIIDTLKNKLK